MKISHPLDLGYPFLFETTRIRLALDDHRPKEAAEALDRLEKDGASIEVIGKLRLEAALREGHPEEAARVLEKLKAKGVVDTEVRLLEAKIRFLEDRPVAALLVLVNCRPQMVHRFSAEVVHFFERRQGDS